MHQNIFAQFVFPKPKVWYFNEKKATLGVRSPCVRPDPNSLLHFASLNSEGRQLKSSRGGQQH